VLAIVSLSFPLSSFQRVACLRDASLFGRLREILFFEIRFAHVEQAFARSSPRSSRLFFRAGMKRTDGIISDRLPAADDDWITMAAACPVCDSSREIATVCWFLRSDDATRFAKSLRILSTRLGLCSKQLHRRRPFRRRQVRRFFFGFAVQASLFFLVWFRSVKQARAEVAFKSLRTSKPSFSGGLPSWKALRDAEKRRKIECIRRRKRLPRRRAKP